MTKEYGVACLLDNESAEKLRKDIHFLEKDNHPHVSLFQFRCDNQDFLSLLKNYLSNISLPTEYLTDKVSLVENNVFLDIKDDSTLKTASNQIAEFYYNFCLSKKPLSQINLSELDQNQINLVKKYGIYWIKENYRPHVTLAYETNIRENFNISIPITINLIRPTIHEIDGVGKILNNTPCHFL